MQVLEQASGACLFTVGLRTAHYIRSDLRGEGGFPPVG